MGRILAIGAAVARGLAERVGAILRPVAAVSDMAMSAICVGGLALLVLAQPAFRETGPNWLRGLDLAVTFLDRNGGEIGHRGILHDDRPGLDELPPHLITAVLATEDRRFFRHHGIDPVGLARALVANAQADSVVQGGSTLTQQLAKNLFLSGERTLDRKIKEAFLAVWLEWRLTKPEILKLYLDRAYLGGGAFGVEAASQLYFGKSARSVSVAEAAVLAGMLKAPSRYGPRAHPDAAAARASDVLDRMVEFGALGRTDAADAKASPAVVVARQDTTNPDYYLDWAFREVERLAAAGRFGGETVLRVETELDPAIQAGADGAVDRAIESQGTRYGVKQAAMVVMTPAGGVRAMVGGHDYDDSQFNRATDALRQPGSSFKPFVYAAALAGTDLRPSSPIQDAEICIGSWCPANYGRSFSGTLSMRDALANSINTVAVRLSVEIGRAAGEMNVSRQARFGRARIIALARSMGITTTLHDTPSLPLGASEVRLIDMTSAYAVFANGGDGVEPYAVTAVRNAHDAVIYRRDTGTPARSVLGPNLVGDMNAMLGRVVEAGTATRAAIPGHAVAGKTGTTSAYRDAWFVGFTGQLVGGIWFGNDDYASTRRLTGGVLPAAVWREVMGPAHRDLPSVPLPGPTTLRVAAGPMRSVGGFSEVATAPSGRGFEPLSAARPGFGFR